MTKIASLLLACAALGCATVPTAAIGQNPVASVQYDDLDLANPADRKKLDHRISAAGRAACASTVNTTSRIRSSQAASRCQASVRAQIEAQIAARQQRTASGG